VRSTSAAVGALPGLRCVVRAKCGCSRVVIGGLPGMLEEYPRARAGGQGAQAGHGTGSTTR
jgi:hypothetical protein